MQPAKRSWEGFFSITEMISPYFSNKNVGASVLPVGFFESESVPSSALRRSVISLERTHPCEIFFIGAEHLARLLHLENFRVQCPDVLDAIAWIPADTVGDRHGT